MDVEVTRTNIPDLLVVSHQIFEDERGFFMEAFREDLFAEQGLPTKFVQCNHSRSSQGVVRGLHFQWEPPMGKLMRVLYGTAFLVAVDIRKNSPTLGKWWGMEISAKNKKQVWAPAGFARGFCVLSDFAEIQYFCTGIYNPASESGIRWDDPEIGIQWPTIANPTLSEKDKKAQTLSEWLQTETSEHFQYGE